MKRYYIEEYLNGIVLNNYFIIIIIEDLYRYFNFTIIDDNIFNDIRTVILTNNQQNEKIIITSKIVSYIYEKYTQSNKIIWKKAQDNKILTWEFYGYCYKKNKL